MSEWTTNRQNNGGISGYETVPHLNMIKKKQKEISNRHKMLLMSTKPCNYTTKSKNRRNIR
jgi:hypothetical protein